MEKEQESLKVTISWDREEIKVVPDPIFVNQNEKVIWECEYPFAIHFGHESLMKSMYYNICEKNDGKYTITATVAHPSDSAGRKFTKYVVALCHRDGRIYIADPGAGVPRDDPGDREGG